MKKVYPLAITEKLNECSDYYVKYFNFKVVFKEDWYVHLVHEESGAELGFMKPNTQTQPKQLQVGFSGKGMVYSFEVTDAKEEFERLKRIPQIDVLLELKDEPWGQRHFIVRDPACIYVDVVQQLEA